VKGAGGRGGAGGGLVARVDVRSLRDHVHGSQELDGCRKHTVDGNQITECA